MSDTNAPLTPEEIKAAALLRRQRVKEAQQERMAIAQNTTLDRVQMPEEYHKAQNAEKIQLQDIKKFLPAAPRRTGLQLIINVLFFALTLIITSTVQLNTCPQAADLLARCITIKPVHMLLLVLNNAKLLLLVELLSFVLQYMVATGSHGLVFWKNAGKWLVIRVVVHVVATIMTTVFCEPEHK